MCKCVHARMHVCMRRERDRQTETERQREIESFLVKATYKRIELNTKL